MATEGFYAELPGFREFRGVTDPDNYRRAPDDWVVLITDVVDSTGAVERGQYKDVNVLSAASIVAIQRVVGELDFPFVFGGDGASALVPASWRDQALTALLALADLAKENFELELRVGAVNIDELRADGYEVLVARNALASRQHLAILDGDGLEEADRRIRATPGRYLHGCRAEGEADLSGLSCRWQAVPSQRGSVASLIIQSRVPDRGLYAEILKRLDETLERGIEESNPVGASWMQYRTVRECIADERRYHRGWSLAWIIRFLEIFLAVAIFRHGLGRFFAKTRKYANDLRTHSDFRKFTGTLHMTLDCSIEEIAGIKSVCEEYSRAGQIHYGLGVASSALMTCVVGTLDEGEHIHFIDAEDGGYTRAATQLKRRIAASGTDSSGKDL